MRTENEIDARVEIVTRREAFERDRSEFSASFADEQKKLEQRITRARRNLANVEVPRVLLRQIAALCSELKVDGHRGELTIMRAARALAAFEGRKRVSENDIRRVALISLRHRLHRDGLSERAADSRIEQALDKTFPGSQAPGGVAPDKQDRLSGPAKGTDTGTANGRNGASETEVQSAAVIDARLPPLSTAANSPRSWTRSSQRGKSGSRSHNSLSGRYVRAVAHKSWGARIALDATLRALLTAGRMCESQRHISSELRFKRFARKQGTLFIFAIDSSGSMAQARISKAKGAVLNLLRDSYINRDSVAIISFRGTSAELVLPPTRSIVRSRRVLESLSVGGGTPLSAALSCALDVAKRTPQADGQLALLLFTDGGANVPLQIARTPDRQARQKLITDELTGLGLRLRSAKVRTVVVGTQNDFVSQAQTQALAGLLRAQHICLSAAKLPETNDRSNQGHPA